MRINYSSKPSGFRAQPEHHEGHNSRADEEYYFRDVSKSLQVRFFWEQVRAGGCRVRCCCVCRQVEISFPEGGCSVSACNRRSEDYCNDEDGQEPTQSFADESSVPLNKKARRADTVLENSKATRGLLSFLLCGPGGSVLGV